MKRNAIAFFLITLALNVTAQYKLTKQQEDSVARYTEVWSPVPKIVTPGSTSADAPSDAIILYGKKKDTSNWINGNGKPFSWKVDDTCITVTSTGEIRTKQSFGDCQLHIEWRTPAVVKGNSQGRGNSGIFLMGRYELQVLDSYDNRTYSNGQAGSIYKQRIPLANACRPPGEWQTYDVIFTAPQFYADSSVKSAARITVLHNGVLVQNNVELSGATRYIGIARYEKHDAKLPLALQDHGNPVSFRNIWIREL